MEDACVYGQRKPVDTESAGKRGRDKQTCLRSKDKGGVDKTTTDEII